MTTMMSFTIRPRAQVADALRRRYMDDEATLEELLLDSQDPSNRYGRLGCLKYAEVGAIERLLARSKRAEAKEG